MIACYNKFKREILSSSHHHHHSSRYSLVLVVRGISWSSDAIMTLNPWIAACAPPRHNQSVLLLEYTPPIAKPYRRTFLLYPQNPQMLVDCDRTCWSLALLNMEVWTSWTSPPPLLFPLSSKPWESSFRPSLTIWQFVGLRKIRNGRKSMGGRMGIVYMYASPLSSTYSGSTVHSCPLSTLCFSFATTHPHQRVSCSSPWPREKLFCDKVTRSSLEPWPFESMMTPWKRLISTSCPFRTHISQFVVVHIEIQGHEPNPTFLLPPPYAIQLSLCVSWGCE